MTNRRQCAIPALIAAVLRWEGMAPIGDAGVTQHRFTPMAQCCHLALLLDRLVCAAFPPPRRLVGVNAVESKSPRDRRPTEVVETSAGICAHLTARSTWHVHALLGRAPASSGVRVGWGDTQGAAVALRAAHIDAGAFHEGGKLAVDLHAALALARGQNHFAALDAIYVKLRADQIVGARPALLGQAQHLQPATA